MNVSMSADRRAAASDVLKAALSGRHLDDRDAELDHRRFVEPVAATSFAVPAESAKAPDQREVGGLIEAIPLDESKVVADGGFVVAARPREGGQSGRRADVGSARLLTQR